MGTLIVMVFLTALYIFLIAPGWKPRKKGQEFIGLNYAHRGLYTQDGSVPENSLAAFRLAVKEGYAVELDVRLTEDGQVVVFHDDSLRRMTGDRRDVADVTLEKLKRLRLLDTQETVPLLTEVLDVVDGKVPMLIEFKRGARNRELCQKAYTILGAYQGLWCMESFDPSMVRWFRRHAPSVWRGQLVSSRREMKGMLKPPMPFLLSNVMFNCLARPHFIAHSKGFISLSVRMSEFMGAAPMVWTVEPGDDAAWYQYRNLSVIFQFSRPRPRFRRRRGER